MFGGIIDAVGVVRLSDETPGGRMIILSADGYWTGLSSGASIAVDGVCLTVTRCEDRDAAFDVVAESMRRTTLGELRAGDKVNLQKPLAAGAPIDGHFVQGHIDAIGEVVRVEQSPRESIWWFSTDADAIRRIIPKGSVAIDGISLTIADVRDGRFSVALIPTTLERTTLGQKKAGAKVNIETDILVRTVLHTLESVVGGDRSVVSALRGEGRANHPASVDPAGKRRARRT